MAYTSRFMYSRKLLMSSEDSDVVDITLTTTSTPQYLPLNATAYPLFLPPIHSTQIIHAALARSRSIDEPLETSNSMSSIESSGECVSDFSALACFPLAAASSESALPSGTLQRTVREMRSMPTNVHSELTPNVAQPQSRLVRDHKAQYHRKQDGSSGWNWALSTRFENSEKKETTDHSRLASSESYIERTTMYLLCDPTK